MLGLDAPTFAAMRGAIIPPSLFNEWAIPQPVPLLDPGKVSGVYALHVVSTTLQISRR